METSDSDIALQKKNDYNGGKYMRKNKKKKSPETPCPESQI